MKKLFKKVSDIVVTAVMGFLIILLTVVLIVGNTLAFGMYDPFLTTYFGFAGGGTSMDMTVNQYFERHAESLEQATNLATQIGIETEGDGAVLMKNDNNALPLAKGSRISCFSQSSVDIVRSIGGGSGSLDGSAVETLKISFERFGIEVNPTLWNFYLSKGNRRQIGGLAQGVSYYEPYRWGINEVPQSQYTDEVKNSYAQYHDAAIVVISRTGCENGDLPRSMSVSTDGANTGSILELDQNEKDMMEQVCANFDKVIVLMNTANVMNSGFITRDYDVDACLWIGGIGQYGMLPVTALLAGKLSPSGRLVDTHVYDVFSSPAMQNMGNFEYTWQGQHGNNDRSLEHHYLTYAEGIYVGYKYYETRYEDKILGRANVGEFDYDAQVAFPFGYGLSYTNFEWRNYSTMRDGDKITVSVNVRNIGTRAGKDVMEVYYQSPYTQYDIDNKVEKSAVTLVEFAKTHKLQPGEDETLTVTFDIEDMKSYDAFGKGTYYLEGSDRYYVTAARDAHAAINNILKAKNGSLDVNGDASFVTNLTLEERVYSTDSVSTNPVGNLFEDCDGTAYFDSIQYLSRNQWTAMDGNGLRVGTPTAQGLDGEGEEFGMEMPAALKTELETVGYAAAKAPNEDFVEPTTGATNGISLIELRGVPFGDPAWGPLLDQITVDEMQRSARISGYGTQPIESINKPRTSDIDGPQGFNNFLGNGISSSGLPTEIVLASTWNQDLARRFGDCVGELCLWIKVTNASSPNLTGWYAPAMNIHRTPFGGRNCEYYSEDAVLSARIGAAVTRGVTDRGVVCYIKHFAMNEQDRNRMTDNVIWAQEQAMREIYFKPFEDSIKQGGALAVMTSYNRIGTVWAGGSYALLTGLLRNEWGFDGFILTDYMDGNWENVDQMLAAGGDGALNTNWSYDCTKDGAQALTYLRRAVHHLCYAFVNSNAMNGIDSTMTVTDGTPQYYYIMAGIDVGVGVLILICIAVIVLKLFVFGRKKNKKELAAASNADDETSASVAGEASAGEQQPDESAEPAEKATPTEEPIEESAVEQPVEEQAQPAVKKQAKPATDKQAQPAKKGGKK